MSFERRTTLHHYQTPFMIRSVPRYARAAQHHVELLIMVSGGSKLISPFKVTLLLYYSSNTPAYLELIFRISAYMYKYSFVMFVTPSIPS